MVKGKSVLAAAVVAASLCAFAGTSHAVVYTEPTSDAGETLATAANAGAATEIDGTLANATDADLYEITLSTPGSYTFSTNNTYTNSAGTDTELSLFTSTGVALLLNDDANGTVETSTITDSLTAGTYYLGVATGGGNEPVNSNSQLLFAEPTGGSLGDTTAVRGPASGVNPTTLSTFNGNVGTYDGSGPYHVTISAPVPEPSTWAVVGASCAALAFLRRRRVA